MGLGVVAVAHNLENMLLMIMMMSGITLLIIYHDKSKATAASVGLLSNQVSGRVIYI